MKEARLILPTVPGSMNAIQEINKVFHGSTVVVGEGYWKSTSERVYIVDVAYTPSQESDEELYDIARTFLDDANQKSVYLRYGNGNVQFVTEKSCMENGETFDWDRLREDIHKAPDDVNDCVQHAEHVALI